MVFAQLRRTWRAKRRPTAQMGKLITSYKAEQDRKSTVWFMSAFIKWNLAGFLLYTLYHQHVIRKNRQDEQVPDDSDKKNLWQQFQDYRYRKWGPKKHVYIKGPDGQQQKVRNPDFDNWLKMKDEEIAKLEIELAEES